MQFIIKHKRLVEKFILDERFTLLEADNELTPEGQAKKDILEKDADILNNLTLQLTSLGNQLNTVFENFKAQNIQLVSMKSDVAKDVLKKLLSLNNAKITIENKDYSLLEIIINEDPTDLIDKLNDGVKALDNLADLEKVANKNDPAGSTALTDAKKVVDDGLKDSAIVNLINTMNELAKNKPANLDNFDTTIEELDKTIKLNTDLSATNLINSTAIDEYNTNNQIISDWLAEAKKIIVIKSILANPTKLTVVVNDIISLYDKNIGLVDAFYNDQLEKEEKAALEQDTNEAKDMTNWDRAIEDAIKENGNVKAVLNHFYEKEFPGVPQEVFSLIDDAWHKELNAFGYNISKNPFMAFLKQMLNSADQGTFISGIKQTNGNSYSAIHDAYIAGYINDTSLKNKKENSTNIIYNPNLYAKSFSDALDLLKWQQTALKLWREGEFKYNILKNRYPQTEKGLADFLTDLFYKGNIIAKDQRAKGDPNGTEFNDAMEIERQLKVAYGDQNVDNAAEAGKNKKSIKLTTTNWNKILPELMKLVKTNIKLKNSLVAYIWNIVREKVPTDTPDKYNLSADVINILRGYTNREALWDQKLKAIFSKYDFENSDKIALQQILKKLSEPIDDKK